MSFPDLTPASTTSAIILPSTGSETDVSTSLAINFYGADTAFLSGAAAQVALTIALVHVMFNVFAVCLIYGVPTLREIPLQLADKLAKIGANNKPAALGYVLGSFFVLPGLIMFAVR